MSVLVSISVSVSFSFLSLLMIKVLINKVVFFSPERVSFSHDSTIFLHEGEQSPSSSSSGQLAADAAAQEKSEFDSADRRRRKKRRKEGRGSVMFDCLTDKSLSCRGEIVVRFTTIMSQNLRRNFDFSSPSPQPPSLSLLPLSTPCLYHSISSLSPPPPSPVSEPWGAAAVAGVAALIWFADRSQQQQPRLVPAAPELLSPTGQPWLPFIRVST